MHAGVQGAVGPPTMLVLVAQLSTLCDPMEPARLLCPWNSPGKNTGVGCHILLQGIFPTQGSNPDLPHCTKTLYHLSHQGHPLSCLLKHIPLSLAH